MIRPRLALLLASTVLAGSAAAQTLPTGGTVAAGSASITTPAADAMLIVQGSERAIINWQDFSLSAGARLEVVQPSAAAALLNRVTGSTPSTIAGQITANGQLVLVNPNGIAITATGTVDAGSFIASTLGIADDDFMAGRLRFTGGGASGRVANAGRITAVPGGYAALLAGQVDNSGLIVANAGRVALASGEALALDLAGDGFLQVAVPTASAGTLVSHSGRVEAAGGTVVIAAATAIDAARRAVDLSGVVEATSVSGEGGRIVLAGGPGGEVAVSGRLAAGGTSGGSVTVTGQTIALAGAAIDASGSTGAGGRVRVGGDREGQGSLARAATVVVDAATTIGADAGTSGNGGDIVVWSDMRTDFAGTITARGGSTAGDGGEVEVSSAGLLGYEGSTDLRAANGATGNLLLDPYNIIISSGTTTGNSGLPGFTPTANESVINATTLSNALATANVTVSTGLAGSAGGQIGNITVTAPVSWSANTRLTLTAANAIAINAPISINGGQLSLNFSGSITSTNLSFGATANVGGTGRITFDGAGRAANALAINGETYALLYSMADVAAMSTTGRSALAGTIAATSSYTDAVIPSFGGTLTGLGNSIDGLTIAAPTSTAVGLFGSSSGVLRDLALTNVAVSAATAGSLVGGLVGLSTGSLTGISVTGTVSNTASGFVSAVTGLGGVAGRATGSSNSMLRSGVAVTGPAGTGISGGGIFGILAGSANTLFATGAVRMANGAGSVGGLAGTVSAGGSLSNGHATGAVFGSDFANVGGIVGTNSGTLSSVYATGSITGGTFARLGGLVGTNDGMSVSMTNTFFDTATSGVTAGVGRTVNGAATGGTGLTTAQLQSGSATGLGSTFAGGAGGLYSYLTAFFPNGVQALSGNAWRNDAQTQALASNSTGAVPVNVQVGATSFGSVTTGANGYFYAALPNGAAPTGQGVALFIAANAATGATNSARLFTSNGNGAQSGLNILASRVDQVTTATSLSTAPGVAERAANSQLATVLGASSRWFTNASGASFVIDAALPTSATVSVTATGPLSVTTAQTLQGQNVTLTGGTGLAINAGIISRPANNVLPTLTLASTTGTLAINALVEQRNGGTVNLNFTGGMTGTGLSFGATTAVGGTGRLAFLDNNGNAQTVRPTGSSAQFLNINGSSHTLIYSMADLAALGGSANGALADNLTSSGTYNNIVVTGSAGTYGGAFTGLGNSIANLSISTSSGVSNTGLFGTVSSTGVVRDLRLDNVAIQTLASNGRIGTVVGQSDGALVNIHINGGSIFSSAANVMMGGLVGQSNGLVRGIWSSANVTSQGLGGFVGGLIGSGGAGTIAQVMTVGATQGGNSSYAGGIAGATYGAMANAVVMGRVNGGTGSIIGGLAGWSTNAVNNALVTGGVTGSGTMGGLVGQRDTTAAVYTNAFWDTQTTGRSTSVGTLTNNAPTTGTTGLTTSGLQTAAVNIGTRFTAGTSGVYPFLTAFYPNGVQAVSGMAYSDAAGTTAAAHSFVNLAAGANIVGTRNAGNNGYYYIQLPAGTLAAGSAAVAYTGTASANYIPSVGNLATVGRDLYGNTLTSFTTTTSLSAAAPVSSALAATSVAAAQTAINGAAGLRLDVFSNSFVVDQAITRSGSVSIQTLSTSAPLTVAAPITVTGGNLTLSTTGSLTISAPLQLRGGGNVALSVGQGITGLGLSFGASTPGGTAGSLQFLDAAGNALLIAPTGGNAQSLTIGGQAYTLLYTIGDFAQISTNTTTLAARYALANNIAGGTWSSAVVSGGTGGFTGIFTGLGNSISNLTISNNTTVGRYGLFGLTGPGALLRDLVLSGGSIAAGGGAGTEVGALAGRLVSSNVMNVRSSASVNAVGANAVAGGLIGASSSSSTYLAAATGNVTGGTGSVGGLVGLLAGGQVGASSAVGTVTGSGATGGLVGSSTGNIVSSSASGNVVGTGGTIGGLVGAINSGVVNIAFATGSVSGSAGAYIGGLAGYNGGTIDSAHAHGAVTAGANARVGGLVGDNGSIIVSAFATGAVSGGAGSRIGGLIGFQTGTGASTTRSFWDTQTSGQAAASGQTNGTLTATGLTTRQLQGLDALPAGVTGPLVGGSGNLGTAFGGAVNGLYPFLTALFPAGVQAVAGTVFVQPTGIQTVNSSLAGAVPVTLVSGTQRLATATTGANGYFYAFAPAGTVANGSSLAVFTTQNSNTLAVNAGTAALSSYTAGTPVQTLDIRADRFTQQGNVALMSAMPGTIERDTFTPLSLAGSRFITSTAAGGFTIDQAILVSGGELSVTAAGSAPLTVSNTLVGLLGINLRAGGDLTLGSGASVYGNNPVLRAGGAFLNNAGSNAVSASFGRWLVYAASSSGNVFGGLDSGNTAVWNTAAGGSVSAGGNRYVFAEQPVLTVTTTSASKTYGDDASAAIAGAYAVSGLRPGVAGAYLGDTASGAPALASAGAPVTASVAGGPYAITAGQGTLAAPGYALQFANNGLLTVNPRAATLTFTANAATSLYGNTPADLTGTVQTSGLVNGDTLSGTAVFTTTATAQTSVGSHAVTGSGLSASNNYTLTVEQAPGNATALTITPRPLTVTYTANAASSTYGDTPSGLTGTVGSSGLVNGDTLGGTAVFATTATGLSNVGSHAITGSGLTASSNYSLSAVQAPGNATALTITPRPLTITYTANALSSVYGDTPGPLSGGVSASGLVNGDVLGGTATFATGATRLSNVGSYAIFGSGATASANYLVTSQQAAGNATALTITPRPLTITYTADAATSIYGDTPTGLEGSFDSEGLVNDDQLSGTAVFTTSATGLTGIGAYAITGDGLTASSNYTLSVVQAAGNATALTIKRRPLTITYTADAATSVYGDTPSGLGGSVAAGGLVNGDMLIGTASFTTTATAQSNVGSHAITGSGITASSNYLLSSAQAASNATALTITRRPILVTADNQSRVYGNANPALGYSVGGMGLVNGDTLTGTLVTAADTTSPVGPYGIGQGGLVASGNYDLTFVAGTLQVTPRPITITADGKSRLYGDANPALTYSIGGLGLVNGDTLTGGLATAANTASNVGGYAITQGSLVASANYAMTYFPGQLQVTPAPLTLIGPRPQKTYGAADPVIGFAVSGLRNGDQASLLTGRLARAAGNDVGFYAVLPGTLSAGPNYSLVIAVPDFRIVPASLRVTAPTLSRPQGTANPLLLPTITGFRAPAPGLPVDTAAVLTAMPIVSTTATNASLPGRYPTVASGGSALNYIFTYVPGTLTVLSPGSFAVLPSSPSTTSGNQRDPAGAGGGGQ